MDKKEASFILANIDRRVCDDELNEALDMAIKALEQEPNTDTWSIKDVADTFKKHGLIRVQEPCGDAISRQAAIDGGNDGIIQLQQGDCLELMKNIPDGSVDMILCDLPFGTTRNKWDSVIDFDELWTAYKRIIKNNGAIVLFCDGMFTAKLLTSNPRMWRYNLVWDKQKGCDFLNANVKPLKCHEDIAVFYKHKPTYNKQYWYSEPYKLTKNGTLSANYGNRNEAWSESVNGERNPLTILSFAKDSDRKHPTQKPIALLEWLIKTYTNEGDIVLDNCMGSGSTGVACVNLKRNFIGMEIEEEYFKIAEERINNARLNQQTGGA